MSSTSPPPPWETEGNRVSITIQMERCQDQTITVSDPRVAWIIEMYVTGVVKYDEFKDMLKKIDKANMASEFFLTCASV